VFPVRYGLDLYILFRTLHSAHTVYLCVPYGTYSNHWDLKGEADISLLL
jgi:hypothetical protein